MLLELTRKNIIPTVVYILGLRLKVSYKYPDTELITADTIVRVSRRRRHMFIYYSAFATFSDSRNASFIRYDCYIVFIQLTRNFRKPRSRKRFLFQFFFLTRIFGLDKHYLKYK